VIRHSLTYTRPDANIPWHFEEELGILTADVKKIIYTKFIMPVKLLYSDRFLSEDNLQLTTISYWDSNESIVEYQNYPKIAEMNLKRNEYYKLHGCIIGEILKTETDKIFPEDVL
jgi:hypothetical protein